MNNLIAIVVMAVFTYLVRVAPFLLLRKPITNIRVKSFLHYIPYSILAAMTVPYIFYATTHFTSAMAGTVTALILGWQKRSLITVSIIAVIVAYIVELIILI